MFAYKDLNFRKISAVVENHQRNGILFPSCSSDREKLLKFEAEGREFENILRSLEQFIQTVKGQTNL